MSDITTRLRQTRANMIGTDDEDHYWDCQLAAGRIDALRAENEKLRAALRMIAETYNKPTTSKDGLAFIAAAALKETGDE